MSARARVAVLAAVAILLAGVAVAFALRPRETVGAQAASVAAGSDGTVAAAGAAGLMVVGAGPGPGSGTVLATPYAGAAVPTGLHCRRFYAAAGTAVCLRVVAGLVTRSDAIVLDAALRERRTVELPGVPSRARVSASGRMVSWTVFVTGDSYLAVGFSTRTGVLDTRTGKVVPSLEEFTLSMDGEHYRSVDLNYWGVTFTADDNRFYATASSRGRTYLVEGDFAARSMKVLQENAECPSLSPDQTRLVYKKRTGDDRVPWRLHVLDLASGRETPLAESANVDDQAAWLDDHTVMYGRLRDDTIDIWSVPADGSGTPALLVRNASSPVPVGHGLTGPPDRSQTLPSQRLPLPLASK
jgi:dipeptidyl aminopeptidase/acylaminoacyl peptidase